MSTKKNRFPEDHPIDLVRGIVRPTFKEMLRTIAHRASYLTMRLTKIALLGEYTGPGHPGTKELIVLARLAELLEQRNNDSGCPHCGRPPPSFKPEA
jgi:hypothetical protein